MEEQYEEGIELKTIIKVAFGRKILLACITILITIIGVLGIELVYNKSKEKYVASFEYSLPGINDGRYIDGSNFNYKTLISLDNLRDAKDSNDNFKALDVEKMYSKNDIEITYTYQDDKNNELKNPYYTISIKEKYFKTSEQAGDFVEILANYPIEKTLEIVKNTKYDYNLTSYNSALTYEAQIDYLNSQINLLNDKYSSLITNYGDLHIDNEQISEHQAKLTLYFVNNPLSILSNELEIKGYVKNHSFTLPQLETQIEYLKDEYDRNEVLIGKYKTLIEAILEKTTIAVDIGNYTAEIAKLTNRNAAIDKELSILEAKVTSVSNAVETPQAFITDLNAAKDALVTFTDEYAEVEKKVYNDYNQVFFANKAIVELDGGISFIISIAISLVAGLAVGCVVNLILDRKKLVPTKRLVREE